MSTPEQGANPTNIQEEVPQAVIVEDGARPQPVPQRAPANQPARQSARSSARSSARQSARRATRRPAQPTAIVVPTRPRGLVNSVQTVLLQPAAFFRTLPALSDTRQWVIIAAVVLALIGFSAIRQRELNETGGTPPVDTGVPVDAGVPIDGGFGDVPIDGGFGGPPPGIEPGVGTPAVADTSGTWTTGIIAASGMVLGWLLLLPLLAIVSLLRGRSPQFGRNWQIAIWASLPLGLMALLQLVYYGNGGQVGSSGVSGLLTELPEFSTWSPLAQNLALSLAGSLTLFWLWSLALVYAGARYALGGRTWAAAIALVLWIGVQVVLPVATGAVDAQKLLNPDTGGVPDGGMPGEMPPGMEVIPGEMPPGFEFEVTPDAQSPDGRPELAPDIASTEEAGLPEGEQPPAQDDVNISEGGALQGIEIMEVTPEAAEERP